MKTWHLLVPINTILSDTISKLFLRKGICLANV